MLMYTVVKNGSRRVYYWLLCHKQTEPDSLIQFLSFHAISRRPFLVDWAGHFDCWMAGFLFSASVAAVSKSLCTLMPGIRYKMEALSLRSKSVFLFSIILEFTL